MSTWSRFNRSRLPVVLLATLWTVVASAQTFTAADDPDGDGMPGLAESPPPLHDGSNGLVVIAKDLSRCYFGLYRAVQMSAEPWDLFDRTVEAMLSRGGGGARILLVTFVNQLQPPVVYQQEDGYAVYVRLLLAGYHVTGLRMDEVPALDVGFLRQFDLIIDWGTGAYGLGQARNSGVPVLTDNRANAIALGLGAFSQDHRMVYSVCIAETHGPTAGCVPGELAFGDWMWTYALEPADDVLTLVRYRCPFVASEGISWGSLKSVYY